MKTQKKGSKEKNDVVQLQKLLNKYGYNLVEDGDFGLKTENAVKAFQKSKGLMPVDGIVGPKTWEALGVKEETKSVDPDVLFLPISKHITKSPNRPIKYLAIHYTASKSSYGGCVKAVRNVFQNGEASADFAVDDEYMAQYNPDIKNYYCWAVGGSKKAGATLHGIATNKNTISIEICSSLRDGYDRRVANHDGWYFTEKVLDNAVKLAKILMKKYNIPVERVIRHYCVTGKPCPGVKGWNLAPLYDKNGKRTGKTNDESEWIKFKERLK